jgi:hypothetical protein
MDRTLLKGLYVILISLGLALVFNFLFFGKEPGLSVIIMVVILLGAIFLFGRQQQLPAKKSLWLVLPIIFFSFVPSLRANEFLIVLNVLATFSLLVLLAHGLVGTPAFLMKLRDYLILLVLVPLRMLSRGVSTLSFLGQIHSKIKQRDVWIRILKGVIMALPVLIIFGVLFSQADLAFSQFVKGFISINISERTVQYSVLLVFAFAAALSFLSYIFFPKPAELAVALEQRSVVAQPGRGIEVLVFLGLISVLFLVFIGFQVTYLFGGETNIISAGFTYAEYARRGFWELLAVAFLSLLVLLASEKYAGAELKRDKKFLIPALILVAEVVVVIVSAFKRLSLYTNTYGMTSLRFYVAGFIILLLALFILLAVKFIKAKQEQFFTFGTLLLVIVFLATVDIINPDAFILRSNTEHFKRTGKVDVVYVEQLSADAVPRAIELYQQLQGPDKEIMRELFLKQKQYLEPKDDHWQSTNFSRTRALKLLQELN